LVDVRSAGTAACFARIEIEKSDAATAYYGVGALEVAFVESINPILEAETDLKPAGNEFGLFLNIEITRTLGALNGLSRSIPTGFSQNIDGSTIYSPPFLGLSEI